MAKDPQRVENRDHKESKGLKMAEREESSRSHGEGRIAKTSPKQKPNAGSTSISGAVRCLEEQTERHSHVPEVGGHKMHGHSGHMKE